MRKLMVLTGLILLLAVVGAATADAQTAGADLFHRGQYRAAYAALWPAISAGDPEAAFYGLVIRRNGLDGRAPAEPSEMAALWNILASRADQMRREAGEAGIPTAREQVLRTALAQLEYFGPVAPAWPPNPGDPARNGRAQVPYGHLNATVLRFTPAMNFLAFVDIDSPGGNHSGAFNRSLQAAEAGDYLAMGNVAWLYRDGLGTEKNNIRAAHWARKGCRSNPEISRNQNEMGYFYESGRGVTQDLKEAARWYEKSSAQGHLAGRLNALRLKSKSPSGPVLDNRIMF